MSRCLHVNGNMFTCVDPVHLLTIRSFATDGCLNCPWDLNFW